MAKNPSLQALLRSPVLLLAFGFGSGLSPKAPGTVGTLAALPLWLLFAQLPLSAYILVVVVSVFAGIYICGRAAEELGVHDHGGIVWDEFVGLWIALIALPVNWVNVVLGFFFFRVFDILKPWPIGWLDKRVPGGAGIMIDDIVAGAMAAIVLLGMRMTGILP